MRVVSRTSVENQGERGAGCDTSWIVTELPRGYCECRPILEMARFELLRVHIVSVRRHVHALFSVFLSSGVACCVTTRALIGEALRYS